MSEFESKKKANERFTSPSFYTSPNGYHMALEVDANGYGDGKGTHVSVFASTLEGKYDTGLKWPFVGKVIITLLNQLEDKNHYTMTTAFTAADERTRTTPWGLFDFAPHTALAHNPVKNTQYLKDDTLHFKVEVQVEDHKPWLQ